MPAKARVLNTKAARGIRGVDIGRGLGFRQLVAKLLFESAAQWNSAREARGVIGGGVVSMKAAKPFPQHQEEKQAGEMDLPYQDRPEPCT